jgi:hypothetical protein
MWCCVILTIELHAGVGCMGKLAESEWHAHFSLRVVPVAARWSTWPRSRVYRSRLQTKLCTGNGTVYLLCSAVMDGPYGWRLPLANKNPGQIFFFFLIDPNLTAPHRALHRLGIVCLCCTIYSPTPKMLSHKTPLTLRQRYQLRKSRRVSPVSSNISFVNIFQKKVKREVQS